MEVRGYTSEAEYPELEIPVYALPLTSDREHAATTSNPLDLITLYHDALHLCLVLATRIFCSLLHAAGTSQRGSAACKCNVRLCWQAYLADLCFFLFVPF